MKSIIGYLKPQESLVCYPLVGSKVIKAYYDDSKDREINLEFAMKSDDQKRIHETLWKLQNYLEELEELISDDSSFSFDGINITNTPFVNQIDDKGNYIFMLDIKAKITTYKKEKN
ncbi:phage tail terminator protein [Floricoccus tropicus]|uniref:phage tail terminator protein n=1 Tax=Floricoccus tropicus TaxID=1859473 RepID=UPI0022770C60|nr:minor capsid protein [Floricoccus tropicus]